MKTPLLLLIVVGVALVAGAGAGQLMGSAPEAPASEPSQESRRLQAVLERLESLEQEQSALRQALEGATLERAAAARTTAVSSADIDAAVARYLEAQPAASLAGAAAQSPPAATQPDAQALFSRLLDDTLAHDERQALWDEAREAGLLDELVALYQQRALDNPQDPQAQVELGEACIQKIFEVGDGPAAGVWAVKADQAYDAALALDEQHWEARFSKAVALSFWPPIFGKQAEAIGQLQTLIEQQSGHVPEPKFVQSYLALGNLYLQSGKAEQAQSVFAAGLQLFPNDPELLAKLSP